MEFLYAFEVEALTLEAGLLILLGLALVTMIGAISERQPVRKVEERPGHEEILTGFRKAA
jgi:hypothetical protein